MSFLLVSYLLNSIVLIILGAVFLKKYLNLGGVFFLIFSVSTSLWFIFFILSYFFTQNLPILELFIKCSYYLSIITLYSFVLFLVYFTREKKSINLLPLVVFWSIIVILGYLYIYTPYIINGLYFDTDLQDWYEVEGIFHLAHIVLSLLFVPLSLFAGIFRFKNSHPIDKKRLQYIFFGMFTFIVLCIVFLLILPSFGMKGQMDRYISFFFLPFIIGVSYAIRKYAFLNFKITFMNVILFTYSLLSSYLVLKVLEKYSSSLGNDFKIYWGIQEHSLLVELTIGILIFIGTYKFARSRLKLFTSQSSFDVGIERMKKDIPFILNIKDLNIYLKKAFREHFHIDNTQLVLNDAGVYKKVYKFFSHNQSAYFIINDIVFIEENKKILGHLYKDISKLNPQSYIISPLMDGDGKIQGVFEVGAKPMSDPFLTSEFSSLKSFSDFLSSHLKYVDIYKQIQDLTVSLDKKVDEKTIEYNTLLSKQKEFIAYVGHEIKNPITNTLFLSDSLREAAAEGDNKEIIEDSNILYDELIKVSELVKYIFSAEKFDLGKVKLYTEKINLSTFISHEIASFRHKFPNINFEEDVETDIMLKIDQIQFRQVIQNLINNSIKFIEQKNAKIYISLKTVKKEIHISIEDNGKGFGDIDISEVFDKYATGEGSAVGLGMGLYLCKKIVELHGGKIEPSHSKKLSGACFYIKL